MENQSVLPGLKEMLAVADRDGLNVVDIRKESHSAKNSMERPIFMSIIKDIREDKIQGLLTWAPDRLSRNAGDLGTLVDLMDQNYLVEIRTYNQIFTNSPNDKFLLMILGSQAKLENDNKVINVKRGLKAKCEMGYRPGMTPLGYLNEIGGKKGYRKTFLDPERAPAIFEMFERVSNGESGRKVLNWLNSFGFKTRQGKPVVLSAIYRMLKNPYYYGSFEYPVGGGIWYKVLHESIINKELFDVVQERLAIIPKSRPGTKEFDFTKLIYCGVCGSGVTAEEKFKRQDNGVIRRYVYYHCTGGKDRNCKQPYIREEEVTEQICNIMDQIDPNMLNTQKHLQDEISRYERFMSKILKQKVSKDLNNEVDLRDYSKFVLREGAREEKRELLNCLKIKMSLKDKKISVIQ
ncbi:MAG: recombinase family protein [Candidatus Berkelbacteria bacterium]|nr:recombinase family protein [Candidatus Berkelbacteria bacterium]